MPLVVVRRLLADYSAEFGRCRRVVEDGDEHVLVYERGLVEARIALDEDGRIRGLFFLRPRASFSSLAQALQAFRALPGRISLLVLEDGRERTEIEPDAVLAVGSAFKLTVLTALRAETASGRRT